MDIHNQAQSVPDAVKQVFEGYLPYGSDYVMYCDSYNSGNVSYTCLFRSVGSKELSSVRVYRNTTGGDWLVSSISSAGDLTEVKVDRPYYAYSNLSGCGRYTASISGQNLIPLMLVVCTCIAILKLVFGGIRVWSRN